MVRVVLLLMMWATSVGAGPWPRGAGQQFLSFSVTSDGGAPGVAAYGEHGLSDRMTLVFSASRTRGGPPRAMVSIARDLWPDRTWRHGWALGLGLHDGDAAARGALAIGRGVRIMGLDGWISGETEVIGTATAIETRAEATLGVTTGGALKLWTQLSVTGDMQIRPLLAPARLTEVRAGLGAALPVGATTWVTLKASQGLDRGGTARISLGIWAEF